MSAKKGIWEHCSASAFAAPLAAVTQTPSLCRYFPHALLQGNCLRQPLIIFTFFFVSVFITTHWRIVPHPQKHFHLILFCREQRGDRFLIFFLLSLDLTTCEKGERQLLERKFRDRAWDMAFTTFSKGHAILNRWEGGMGRKDKKSRALERSGLSPNSSLVSSNMLFFK